MSNLDFSWLVSDEDGRAVSDLSSAEFASLETPSHEDFTRSSSDDFSFEYPLLFEPATPFFVVDCCDDDCSPELDPAVVSSTTVENEIPSADPEETKLGRLASEEIGNEISQTKPPPPPPVVEKTAPAEETTRERSESLDRSRKKRRVSEAGPSAEPEDESSSTEPAPPRPPVPEKTLADTPKRKSKRLDRTDSKEPKRPSENETASAKPPSPRPPVVVEKTLADPAPKRMSERLDRTDSKKRQRPSEKTAIAGSAAEKQISYRLRSGEPSTEMPPPPPPARENPFAKILENDGRPVVPGYLRNFKIPKLRAEKTVSADAEKRNPGSDGLDLAEMPPPPSVPLHRSRAKTLPEPTPEKKCVRRHDAIEVRVETVPTSEKKRFRKHCPIRVEAETLRDEKPTVEKRRVRKHEVCPIRVKLETLLDEKPTAETGRPGKIRECFGNFTEADAVVLHPDPEDYEYIFGRPHSDE